MRIWTETLHGLWTYQALYQLLKHWYHTDRIKNDKNNFSSSDAVLQVSNPCVAVDEEED